MAFSSGYLFLRNRLHATKGQSSFACQCICKCNAVTTKIWPEVTDTDKREVIDSEDPFDAGMDLLNYMEMQTAIQKLLMKLNLMIYSDLAMWPQIIRNLEERGFLEPR